MSLPITITHPFSKEQLKLEEIEAKTRGKSKSTINVANFKKCPYCDNPVFLNWSSCWNWACQGGTNNKEVELDRSIKRLWDGLSLHSPSFENMSFNSAEFNFDGKKIRLKEKTFRNCTFIGTHFLNIVFDHCTFENINFTGASFQKCFFKGVTFENCDVFYAKFEQTDFGDSLLSELALVSSFLEGRFKKVNLTGSFFEECSLKGKFDKKCIISNTKFLDCNLHDLDLSLASTDDTVVIEETVPKREEDAEIDNEEAEEVDDIDNEEVEEIEVTPSSLFPKSSQDLYISHPFSGNPVKLEEIVDVGEKTKSNVNTADLKKCPNCNAPVFFNWSYCWKHSVEKPDAARKVEMLWEDLRAYSFIPFENMSFNSAELNFEGRKKHLKEMTFRNCTFISTHFSNIVFDHCTFEHINFTGTTFRKCSFKSATFKNCDIRYAKFEQTDFGNSLLSELALFSSLFKCHFKKVEFKNVTCEKCFLNAKLDKRCKISKTTFSNCNMHNLDLSLVDTDNTVIITGKDTKIKKLSLNMSQRKDALTLEFHDDSYKIIKTNFLFLQNCRLESVRCRIIDKIALIFDCVVIAALISLLSYTIWAFFDNKTSLEPFYRIAAYTFVVIFSLGFYSSYRIEKNDSKYLEQIRSSQEQPLQDTGEGFWEKFDKSLNMI